MTQLVKLFGPLTALMPLVISCGHQQDGSTAALTTPPSPEPTSLREVTIDLLQCEVETLGFSWAFGSERVKVVGPEGNSCVFRHSHEVEGGYIIRECRVPTSLRTVTIAEDWAPEVGVRYSIDLASYCTVIRTGNVFLD